MAHSIEEKLFSKMMHFGRLARKSDPTSSHGDREAGDPGCPHRKGDSCGNTDPGKDQGPDRPHGHRRHHHPMLSRERILTLLLNHEEGLRQKEMAGIMGVNASSMSEFITRLEDGDYIRRQVDPGDKRATLITLTDKGRARACEIQDERRERMDYLFRNLTDEEKQELLRLLDKVMNGG